MEQTLNKVILVTIMGVILIAILLGLRSTALKSAYDASAAFTINDSGGTVHSIAASGISGDTVATIYSLAAGLVGLAVVVVDILLIVKMIKVK